MSYNEQAIAPSSSSAAHRPPRMQQITPLQLKAWLDDPAREKPVLIDVREPWEFELCRIPGSCLAPMSTIPGRRTLIAS